MKRFQFRVQVCRTIIQTSINLVRNVLDQSVVFVLEDILYFQEIAKVK